MTLPVAVTSTGSRPATLTDCRPVRPIENAIGPRERPGDRLKPCFRRRSRPAEETGQRNWAIHRLRTR